MVTINQSQWVKRITVLAVILFTVYIAQLSAKAFWFVIEKPASTIPSSFSASGTGNAQPIRLAKAIDRYHLFGEVNTVEAVVEKPKEAPKTKLRLLLKGVFTGDEGRRSGAIIEEIGKSAEYYKIGDALPGNATLAEVYPDRVLLDRSGNYETLYFEEGSSSNVSITEVVPEERERNNDIRSPEEFIEEATARLTEDPERALNSVGLGIAQEGGYVFTGSNPMLSGMNLQRGDIIRSVNGHTLGDLDQDKEMLRSLYEQGSVEVEVVRDGASFFVNYPLR